MKQTKKLHQLIELAKGGKKFKARRLDLKDSVMVEQFSFCYSSSWTRDAIIADWEYIEIREPEVVEFDCEWNYSPQNNSIYPVGMNLINRLRSLMGRRWKVVCTEIMETEGE